MNTSTLILIVVIVLATFLLSRALIITLQRGRVRSTDVRELWPPRYFLDDQRSKLAAQQLPPRVITAAADDPPTSSVPLSSTRQTGRLSVPPHAPSNPARELPDEMLEHPPDDPLDRTSRVPREILQHPPDDPLDRTSQFARPVPPLDSE